MTPTLTTKLALEIWSLPTVSSYRTFAPTKRLPTDRNLKMRPSSHNTHTMHRAAGEHERKTGKLSKFVLRLGIGGRKNVKLEETGFSPSTDVETSGTSVTADFEPPSSLNVD